MATISTQKALLLPEAAGKWTLGEVEVPRPGPHDVLVKVMSAALNPVDWKVVDSYSALIPEYPFISGTDGAGIVEQVGEAVTTLKKGDKILFQGWFTRPYATFQQYCLVPAAVTAKIPGGLSFDQAASVPLALATVVLALWDHNPRRQSSIRLTPPWEAGGLTEYAGKPAFIIGGASSVGQYAIQLAKYQGFSPIITTASPRNTERLKALGATAVLDRALAPAQILAELPKLTDAKPIEFVYDAISLSDTQPLAYQALAEGGALVIVLPDLIPTELKKAGDGKRIAAVHGNVQIPECRPCGEELYKRLTEWLETGIVKPNEVEILPGGLAGIPDGLARLESFQVSGAKLIARPQETV